MPSAKHESPVALTERHHAVVALLTSDVGDKCRSEARGEARAVLTVLEARGVAVPAEVRDKILACTDLAQLDSWLRRATTATYIHEVVGR